MEKNDKITLEIEVDRDIYEKSRHIYRQLGIDLDTAINIFLRHSVLNRGFPFDITRILYRPEDTIVNSEVYYNEYLSDKEIEEELKEFEE